MLTHKTTFKHKSGMRARKSCLFLTVLCALATPNLASAGKLTLTWDSVSSASHYQVEMQVDGAWEVQTEDPIALTEFETEELEPDAYTFRVSGCIEEPSVTIHCGDAIANYAEGTFTLADSTQRRVIFIHTDLLGSPAAETDKNGEEL